MTDWTQDDTRQFLAESELFSEIPEDARAGLAPAAQPRLVSADEVVFKRGDEGDSFFVVAKGKVSITLELPSGSQEVSTLQAGDFFGEIAMLTEEKLSWDPKEEKFTNSDLATHLLVKPYRNPWNHDMLK